MEGIIFLIIVGAIIFFIKYIFQKICENIKELKKQKEYDYNLKTDPTFRLREEYKEYIDGFLYNEQNFWLYNRNEEEIIKIESSSMDKKILFEGTINDPFFQKIIEIQKTLGEELRRCRECGRVKWSYINKKDEKYYHYYKNWDGFCSERCKEKCIERDIQHYWRSKNSSLLDYEYKFKKKLIKNNEAEHDFYDTIPLFEYSKKQNFLCAICNGKMVNKWNNKERNYLYYTVDHIHPISKGGQHKSDNIQICHFLCNMVKGTGKNIRLSIKANEFLDNNIEIINNEEELINEYKKYII
jgi:5-methylcytosine-specific restriction endonuclease McrA